MFSLGGTGQLGGGVKFRSRPDMTRAGDFLTKHQGVSIESPSTDVVQEI